MATGGTIVNILAFILVLFFIAANIFCEAVRRDLNPISDPMSSYLTGPYGRLQSAAFLGLGVVMLLLIPKHPGVPWKTLLAACAVAMVIVVATKWLQCKASAQRRPKIETAHVVAAGVAFATATAAELIYFWHTPIIWLAWGAPVSAAVWSRFAPNKTALEEKSYALFVSVCLIAITGIAL